MPSKISLPLQLPFDLPLEDALKTLDSTKRVTFVNVANEAAKSFLISRLQRAAEAKNILWVSNQAKADTLVAPAQLFFPGTIQHVPVSPSITELYTLREALLDKTPHLFVFDSPSALSDITLPDDATLKKHTLTLKPQDTVAVYELFAQLESAGYSPVQDLQYLPGTFIRQGDTLFLTPPNGTTYQVALWGDEVESIHVYVPTTKEQGKAVKKLNIPPMSFAHVAGGQIPLGQYIEGIHNTLVLRDDIDSPLTVPDTVPMVSLTSFPKEEETFYHQNFFSVLPFYTVQDWITDMKERLRRHYTIVIVTKRLKELEGVMKDAHLMWTHDLEDETPSTLKVIPFPKDGFMPHSFQNNEQKILFLTDREIWQFHRSKRQQKAVSGMNAEMMMSLKPEDYVVHMDHGLAKFEGIIQRSLPDSPTREYLKLQYAGNDRLFLPVESAEKVTKFIGEDVPRLTKLDSTEWTRSQKKLHKETEKIAEELLKIYAKREMAKGTSFVESDDKLQAFIDSFPYEPTPGQHAAWADVQRDMESSKPMDRLVCGDVGFGKTEIAMRAAFKAFCSGVQCAILAPITILAEQHYQSFQKRLDGTSFGTRIALLSRFQSPAEQKAILKGLKEGTIDIVIGTHRLLSPDIQFKNLGLLVIDEEQRFGVKQKEKIKQMRANVDLLTLTATPIPRTLHMGLNKLKEITTITTPPPGRLPVITEVRRYSPVLIREAILKELERNGQVYFLHNEVKTIESQAEQLRQLIPEASIIVAHGQLSAHELERRIKEFKSGAYNVLVASTIIENGIDLPNANTLFVNKADRFGLSQLYQLRGRVGRGRTQAYAYFLYQHQKLDLEAKKRLRAIVEASELGSGFQIAMRDLEIRGAGEILGANQSGAMKSVGVSHFLRVLHKTMKKMQSGEIDDTIGQPEENINVDVPLNAYIPGDFIPNTDEKIQVYQQLAAASDAAALAELRQELREDYGTLPVEVENLCKVIQLKLLLRSTHLSALRIQKQSSKAYTITLRMGKQFNPAQVVGLMAASPRSWTITAEALKLKLTTLPVTWFTHLVEDLTALLPQTSKK